MVEEYLPQLPIKRWAINWKRTVPKRLLQELRDGVALRNAVTHTGAATFSGEKLDRILQAVSDLLWVLDVCVGEAWAVHHISVGTMMAWEKVTATP